MKQKELLMLAILFIFLTFFGPAQAKADEQINYRIKPVPTADRTNLEIFVRFKSEIGKPVNIKLPTDYYGTPDLYRFVTSFQGEGGTIVKAGKTDSERVVEPNPNGEIQLKYLISYDPAAMSGTYSPNISPKRFHVAGCQWLLQIGDISRKNHLSIEMIDTPQNWQMYSSIDANPLQFETDASYYDLISTAIGGGEKQNFRQFKFRDKPVSVFIQGNFDIPDREIFAAVEKIVALQRSWFNDYNQPFYNVVILPKEDNVAGTRIENQFICFIKKDITREQLYVLLAHEMFHNWLDSSIIKPEKGVSGLRYAWFYEGVNDYFARKTLFDAGLLSKEKFAALVNRDIINIANNPHKSATFDELIDATKTGKYGQAFNKLSYYRGALIALNWETQIRNANKGKSLGDFIREAYGLSRKTDGITEQDFFALAGSYGMSAKTDFESYILRGEPIQVLPDALGNSFALEESTRPSFDPGFDLNESFKQKKVIGVKENSPAFKAGLRNDVELVDGENINRFGNAWNPDKPMIIVVKENALNRQIKFLPHGEPQKLMLFQSKKPAK